MSLRIVRIAGLIFLAALTSACDSELLKPAGFLGAFSGDKDTTPDEFLVLPQKPLEMPESLTVLPVPAPGSVNRTDQTPRPDALRALGGRANAGTSAQSDSALLAAARVGSNEPGIRTTLRADDNAWRANNRGRLLERWFKKGSDGFVYGDMTLDAYAELQRLRLLGLRTPSAPPEGSN